MSIRVLCCLSLAICVYLVPLRASALEGTGAVKVTQLLKTSTTWNNQPLVYPNGPVEVTGLLVELDPGAETGWHSHSVPSFAMVLEGELEITLRNGYAKRMVAGDAVAEVVGEWHNGRNTGETSAKLVVFYVGVEGVSLTTHAIQGPYR